MNTNTQHTPKPWVNVEWSCHAKTTVIHVTEGGKRIIVAECGTEADADFIAAAPETAAERDRLKGANQGLLAANENVCLELDRLKAVNAEQLEALELGLKRLGELEFHFGKRGHSSGDTIQQIRATIARAEKGE